MMIIGDFWKSDAHLSDFGDFGDHFFTILDPECDPKPQLASKYELSLLFEVGYKFTNQLFEVIGFLQPQLLKMVRF